MSQKSVTIVGLSGGSCSGKTTLGRALWNKLGPERCGLLFQDSYYIDQSHRFKEDGGEVNFDHPNSLEFTLLAKHLGQLRSGQSVKVPIYDFVTHTRRKETQAFEPKAVILVDGILILSQAVICAELDHSVFVRASEQTRFERRKRRDVQERGRALDGVVRQFLNHVKPMHDAFVEPSCAYATEIFSGEETDPSAVDALIKKLKL